MTATRQASLSIVLFGETMDMQLLNFVCQYYKEHVQREPLAYLNSFTQINYCSLPSGLTLIHVMILRATHAGDQEVLGAVRNFYLRNDDYSQLQIKDESIRKARKRDVESIFGTMKGAPDLLVMGSHTFPLQKHSNTAAFHLEPEYMIDFEHLTRDLLQSVRGTFTSKPIAVRTSPEIKTHCEHGRGHTPGSEPWLRRSYAVQLNAAVRHVAVSEEARLVDLEVMGLSFTPTQLLADGLHPRAFFAFEYMNVLLHIISFS